MFKNPTFIRVLNAVALVIFVLVMIISLILAVWGISSVDSIFNTLEGTQVYHGSDTVSGWATIASAIGVGLGSLGIIGAALFGMIGIVAAVADLLIYLPAFIARRIYKKRGVTAAYWILMALWALPLLLCLILFVSEGGLILFSL